MTGAQRARPERRHLAQSLRAVPAVALGLLRIADVRHRPDEEVARAEHTAIRTVHPRVIVGLAPAVAQLEAHAADRDLERVVVPDVGREVRRAEVLEEHLVPGLDGAAELARVQRRVVARRALVAREALAHAALGDHARTRLARRQEGREAVGVVEVAVGEDRGVDRRLRAGADARRNARRERRRAGIDEHEALVGLEGGDAARLGCEPGARGNLDRAAGPEEARLIRRLVRHREHLERGVVGCRERRLGHVWLLLAQRRACQRGPLGMSRKARSLSARASGGRPQHALGDDVLQDLVGAARDADARRCRARAPARRCRRIERRIRRRRRRRRPARSRSSPAPGRARARRACRGSPPGPASRPARAPTACGSRCTGGPCARDVEVGEPLAHRPRPRSPGGLPARCVARAGAGRSTRRAAAEPLRDALVHQRRDRHAPAVADGRRAGSRRGSRTSVKKTSLKPEPPLICLIGRTRCPATRMSTMK